MSVTSDWRDIPTDVKELRRRSLRSRDGHRLLCDHHDRKADPLCFEYVVLRRSWSRRRMRVNDGHTSRRDDTCIRRIRLVSGGPRNSCQFAVDVADQERGTFEVISRLRREGVQPRILPNRVVMAELSACAGGECQKQNDCQHARNIGVRQRKKLWPIRENLRRKIESCGSHSGDSFLTPGFAC
jgi:hypothetical protein